MMAPETSPYLSSLGGPSDIGLKAEIGALSRTAPSAFKSNSPASAPKAKPKSSQQEVKVAARETAVPAVQLPELPAAGSSPSATRKHDW